MSLWRDKECRGGLVSTSEQWLQNQKKVWLVNQLSSRTPTEAERRKPIKVASLQHLMYHLEIDAVQPILFFLSLFFHKFIFWKYLLGFQLRHFNATHFGFPLLLNVASFKSRLLALFKFPIKIKVAHLGEEGGSPYQNVSIKCQDNIFSTYTNLLKTKNCHINIAFFLNLRYK